jgi:hypothetical protein
MTAVSDLHNHNPDNIKFFNVPLKFINQNVACISLCATCLSCLWYKYPNTRSSAFLHPQVISVCYLNVGLESHVPSMQIPNGPAVCFEKQMITLLVKRFLAFPTPWRLITMSAGPYSKPRTPVHIHISCQQVEMSVALQGNLKVYNLKYSVPKNQSGWAPSACESS